MSQIVLDRIDRAGAMVADDLTGAMDSGLQIHNMGMRVLVLIDSTRLSGLREDGTFFVVDTESRNISPGAARSRLGEAVSSLGQAGVRLQYKKVDSTLRGNIGAELDATLSACPERRLMFAPALPWNGRTTVRGVQYVHGVPLSETELGSDPFSPVTRSEVAGIIAEQCSRSLCRVGLEVLEMGAPAVARALDSEYRRGVEIAIADAVTDEHLETLARAITMCDHDVLPCGSAGLFKHIAALVVSSGASLAGAPLAGGLAGGGAGLDARGQTGGFRAPVLVASGSPSAVSKAQIALALARPNTLLLQLDEESTFAGEAERQTEIERLVRSAVRSLKDGHDVILDASGTSKKELLNRYRNSPGLLSERSDLIQGSVAEFVSTVLDNSSISGLCLVGGDTAVAVCRRLEAHAIQITGEVEPFVPSGRLRGGARDSLPVVTKAGGFGREAAIADAITLLRCSK